MVLANYWGLHVMVVILHVYPSALKAVIRARYPDVVKDWVDPTGPEVYTDT